jgi:nucleoside-diphosphate-sugar epimerase
MRILLAGAAGFVGAHLATKLLAQGNHVIGVDNLSTGRLSNLSEVLDHPKFDFVQQDAIDFPASFSGSLDWVLHLASPASPPKYLDLPIETMRINGEGTYRLLELARRTKAKFLFASTSEIYGDPLVHPQEEQYWGNVNIVGPRSVYDEGKRYGEAMVHAYNRHFGMSTRVMRIFNTYGPGMDPGDGRVVSNMICQALAGKPLTIYGDGSQTRSFQYVSDLVEGILRLMKVEYHGPVNLGNPDEYTVSQLAQMIKDLTSSKSEIQSLRLPKDDPKQRRPNIDLAKKILGGWHPQVPLREGLLKTISYFKSIYHENEASTFEYPNLAFGLDPIPQTN